MNFKLIKSKEFTFTDASKKEVKGVVHTIAHKGRVMNVSSLNFDAKDISIKGDVITLPNDIELVREPYTDFSTGATVMGIKVMPKMDLAISQF